VIELGFIGAQELAPGRCIKKKIPDLNRGALRVGGRLYLHIHLPTLANRTVAGTGVSFGITGERQTGHSAYAGQGLTPESQAAHLLQLFQRVDFRSGMPGQRQWQVLWFDTTAIITYANHFGAGSFHIDIHPGGTSIQSVFQHLFDNRGRAFHHLPGSNLVSQPWVKAVYSGWSQGHSAINSWE